MTNFHVSEIIIIIIIILFIYLFIIIIFFANYSLCFKYQSFAAVR